MTGARLRLGAVGYLNARPLVYGLERNPRFSLRFDVPSQCSALLHGGSIDAGIIPSIEFLRGSYRIVPDMAIASRGPVKSVALYASKPIEDVRSIALDTSSRTSVALVRVLCARGFRIQPSLEAMPPDLPAMLAKCDAGLIIGDNALFLDGSGLEGRVEKIDLGEVWTKTTGVPFVYAFWAGREGTVLPEHIAALQRARDEGVEHPDEIVRDCFPDRPDRQAVGAAYLRDNIKCRLGADELEGLRLFYRYAAETGVVPPAGDLRFF